MAKRRVQRKGKGRRGPAKGFAGWFLTRRQQSMMIVILTAVVLIAGCVWFWYQPPQRQDEVKRIVINYVSGRRRHVNLFEMAFDIWQLYYGEQPVKCEEKPHDACVFGGVPRRLGNGNPLRILRNRAYMVGYDDVMRTPVWVAYRLVHSDYVEIGERPEQFMVDNRTLARVTSDDYTGSGYDRGHLAPNFGIARCWGAEAQAETFLMSNIVPQRHDVNAGNWRALELKEACSYADRFEEIWVVTGPVFKTAWPRWLPGGIPVPDGFYKIQVDWVEGGVRTQAFLFPQDGTGTEKLPTLLVSIDDIEALTGLDFFPELPETVQSQLEARPCERMW